MRKLFVLSFACLLIVGVALADEHARMRNGTVDPSAVGTVDYHHDRNGNTSFEVKAEHLATPTGLQPPKQVYVVWVQAPGQPPENKGALKVNEKEEGNIKLLSPYPSFDVFVTAEDNAAVTAPSGPEVLHGTVENR